jgi:hypothetical protein
MKKFEICIVSKEYRWVVVYAEDEVTAQDQVWVMIGNGYVGDTKPEDYDTELFVEGETAND